MTQDATSPPSPAQASAGALLETIRYLFASLPVPVLVVDSRGAVVLANRESLELLGYGEGELLGLGVDMLVPDSLRQDHALLRRAYQRRPTARLMGASLDLLARHRDGHAVPVEIALKPLPDIDGDLVLVMIFDLTVRKRFESQLREQNRELEARVRERTRDLEARNREMAEVLASLERARAELERLSREDPLTGLNNRREFVTRVGAELHRARRKSANSAMAMIDIDHFKGVNDSFGHAAGDAVLRGVADLLRTHCRQEDLLSRYGGEEFALFLPDTALDEAGRVCERMRAQLEGHDWSGRGVPCTVTISIGVAAHRPPESQESLLARADAMMYRAKAAGRNRVCMESPDPSADGPGEMNRGG